METTDASGALGALGAGASEVAEPARRTISLAVGDQRQIGTGGPLARVAIGDPAVVDVLVVKGGAQKGAVLLVGKSAGTTNLMLWTKGRPAPTTYAVEVRPGVAAALLDSSTPRVRTLGAETLISGATPTMRSHQRALATARAAKGKADGNVIDISTIATPGVVQVDVRVVEFSRTVLKQAGFNFARQNNGFSFGTFSPSTPTSVTVPPTQVSSATSTQIGPAITSSISSAFNLVFSSATHGIFSDLSLLENNNLARVLAEPTLVALSGQSASFLAGGEIPVPVPEGLGTTSIEYKPYGVGLTLTPTVLSPTRIALKVAPEASELDFQNAVTINGVSVPAITTRRADTTVELGDGESFVIGGLVDRETRSNVSKVPLLGDLPIIGAFFKQLNYSQSDEELVIIVTPHLVSPLAKGARLPATPGEQSEQRNAPVWRSYLGGAISRDAGPGFSQ
ncbi:type II and III secretion system protein family protein [Trinickia symbiotica]|uniref:Uncharacterized protein n=1 Tax=Trinickia symbiotica TaxID=863227 RepID=A0A2N7X9Z5_9BURK|nr:type II and III secretion system protein family protein [Trinickia symbiotica]PMS38295.1 hypothetical protein C0Z20_04640 [Trinickia symbiotica]